MKIKPVKPVDFATSMQQITLYLQDVKRTLCLRNIHNQSIAICRQIILDIEVEYFCDNTIYHYPTTVLYFSVNTMRKL